MVNEKEIERVKELNEKAHEKEWVSNYTRTDFTNYLAEYMQFVSKVLSKCLQEKVTVHIFESPINAHYIIFTESYPRDLVTVVKPILDPYTREDRFSEVRKEINYFCIDLQEVFSELQEKIKDYKNTINPKPTIQAIKNKYAESIANTVSDFIGRKIKGICADEVPYFQYFFWPVDNNPKEKKVVIKKHMGDMQPDFSDEKMFFISVPEVVTLLKKLIKKEKI